MKKQIFATILLLFVFLSLTACAEKKPTKYAKNDFANLLTTDFWSMTEADLDAFLSDRRWKSVPDAEGRYLGSFMKETAVLCATYNAEGKVTALTVEQQPQTETTEDAAAEFARFVSEARQVFSAHDIIFGGVKLQGKTEEELLAYFRATLDMRQATAVHAQSVFEAKNSYLESCYRLSVGGTAELAIQVVFHQNDRQAPMQLTASQSLHLCAPTSPNPQPSEPESDVWAAYRNGTGEGSSLPEWLFKTDRIEMTQWSTRFFCRMFPQEHVDALLHALPQWVGNPMDADSVPITAGTPAYQLSFYNGSTLLGSITLKEDGWFAVHTASDGSTSNEADAYYRFNTKTRQPDLQAIFDLCPRRHLLPQPAELTLTSPEGETAVLSPTQATELVERINATLRPTSDLDMTNVAERLRDGGYWILRVITEEGEEIEIWLDCYTPISHKVPFSRFKDNQGIVGFSLMLEQMNRLIELLQSYLE